MKKILSAVCFVAVGITTVHAQTASDVLRFSRYNYNLGTARSIGMGGAFSSLGADASSIGINPAGLGMYRSNEITYTPALSFINNNSVYEGLNYSDEFQSVSTSANKTKYLNGNFGLVVHESDYANRGWAVGFSYNRLADFNGTVRVQGFNGKNSIADKFMTQLNHGAYDPTKIGPGDYRIFDGINVADWGAVLAYQTFLVNYNPAYGGYTLYEDAEFPEAGPVFGANAQIIPQYDVYTSGGVDEYSLALGSQVSDALYLGVAVGIQDLRYKEHKTYTEVPFDNTGGYLQRAIYDTYLEMEGTGFNVKLGAVVTPIPNLRIGLAVHTPSFIDVSDIYQERMTVNETNSVDAQVEYTPEPIQEYTMQTPTRLIGGLSYVIARSVILSADYELTWFNGMRADGLDLTFRDDIKREVKAAYRATSNVKAGIEANLGYGIFLRGGYGFYSSVYKRSDLQDYGAIQNVSCGIGYRTDKFFIDAAYINSQTKELPYYLYSYNGNPMFQSDGITRTEKTTDNVLLTFGYKF